MPPKLLKLLNLLLDFYLNKKKDKLKLQEGEEEAEVEERKSKKLHLQYIKSPSTKKNLIYTVKNYSSQIKIQKKLSQKIILRYLLLLLKDSSSILLQ